MSNVQAVIAALNQQSSSTKGTQPTLNRRSKPGPDIASLRSQFGSSSTNTTINTDKAPKRSSQEVSNPKPSRHLSSHHLTPIDTNTTKTSLIQQLEKVTIERDHLKQQLDGWKIKTTPESPACASLTKKEISTLPPGPSSFCWFDISDIYSDATCQGPSQHLTNDDQEDIINTYHQQASAQNQQQQQIADLQQQLAACDIGTQWMINKYVGELEHNRLYTNLLASIVKNQEKLINAIEHNNKPASLTSQEQQIILLQSQLELQRMELDDKEDLVTLMAEERDILVEKVKELTHQLLYNTEGGQQQQPRHHPRTTSSSSTGSSFSSCTSTTSLSTLSLIDWVNVNNIQQFNHHHHQSAPLTKPPSSRSISPPQTPPPKQKLPLLPSSSSSSLSSTTSNSSPRSTLLLTPSSSPIGCLRDSVAHHQKLVGGDSVQDMLLHDPSLHYNLGSSFDGKGLGRQKSFWKGWKNRLSG
ncbi:hypothetical protein BC941DRAFT_421136 [Chlamydoabsidia padenii]|nr:hypothetical protein BC941DRAFT_421136 [Chlamydoabsidia padenii]